MSAGNLKVGITKLSESLEDLMEAWERVNEHWYDENSQNFRENHLEPLVPKFKAAIDSSNYMNNIIEQAVRRFEEPAH